MATVSTRSTDLYRGTQIVRYILYVIEALLVFRFFLKLIGANPSAGFTDFIYTISKPFAAPFLNVVGASSVSDKVFEWTTLLAMLVYWIVAIGIIKLLSMGRPVSPVEAEQKLSQAEDETPINR